MPGAAVSEPPSVSLSFANNFWGKDDAGVSPLLERMHDAKVTGDELKAFYTARAAIEDEYGRKLLSLSRKPLGSSEAGTLRMSLDVTRAEIESMGKAHQNIAAMIKRELEEPLAAFAGGLKERRKIVQGGIEKLLKLKMQQTATVNKTRDRYEQDCLKIKGFLAQAHMVMGHEERKNKAKLEKTQIQLSNTSNEYEEAVKSLEETTGRWNRDWKAACDKFQDFEEERIQFMKSSLWNFANIYSEVCVSDDACCEKIRLSLEDCDVEKDICGFIKDSGTGQEIPDPPKFINFCRGDVEDHGSEASEEGYSVAQFQRTLNPAFRSSSPQPSVFESHHDPTNPLAKEFGHQEQSPVPDSTPTPRAAPQPQQTRHGRADQNTSQSIQQQINQGQFGDIPKVPYNEHPPDGMTQFCRNGPPTGGSERSYVMVDPMRPSSSGSQSECSDPNSFSSMEYPSGAHSPTKQMRAQPSAPAPAPAPIPTSPMEDVASPRKKGGFFQNSPFRRKSKHEKEHPVVAPPTNRNNTWGASNPANDSTSPMRKGPFARSNTFGVDSTNSPEPVDPRANFQLNVGNNVFDVASPDSRKPPNSKSTSEELDPIAQALAELKGVTKQSSVRVSADRYHGLATPAPPGTPGNANAAPVGGMPTPLSNATLGGAKRGTPPPSYDLPMSHLGAPKPAHTARQMQQTTQRYIDQKQNMFNSSSRPPTRGSSAQDTMPRATSPIPPRATSPRPGLYNQQPQQNFRAPSPNPYNVGGGHTRAHSSSPIKGTYGNYSRGNSPSAQSLPRALSPQPQFAQSQRPGSSRGSDMAIQLAPGPNDNGSVYGGSQRGRSGTADGRPSSSYYNHSGIRSGSDVGIGGNAYGGGGQVSTRVRSKSVAEPRQYTRDGRMILHYARSMYNYTAQIPQELSFSKGDVLAVLRLQDDGWWEAEVVGKNTKPGLVPSNYLQNC